MVYGARRVPATLERQSSRSGGGELNVHCLARAARRIVRYHPEVYRADVLQPIVLDMRRFDSIALNYVMHCLPVSWPQKGAVFAHLKSLLNPGGTRFGAGSMRGERCTTAEGLEQHLDEVRVEQVGCVALFSGRAFSV
jgi:hypothetical protein